MVLPTLFISARICLCSSPWARGSSGSGRSVVQAELVIMEVLAFGSGDLYNRGSFSIAGFDR